MADDASTEPVAASWRIFFAITTLAFCAGTSLFLAFYGTPTNTLQATLLDGCIKTSWLVLTGVGIGQIVDPLAKLLGKGS